MAYPIYFLFCTALYSSLTAPARPRLQHLCCRVLRHRVPAAASSLPAGALGARKHVRKSNCTIFSWQFCGSALPCNARVENKNLSRKPFPSRALFVFCYIAPQTMIRAAGPTLLFSYMEISETTRHKTFKKYFRTYQRTAVLRKSNKKLRSPNTCISWQCCQV